MTTAVQKREAEDFAAAVRGVDPDSQSFRRFVLVRLRAARLMARGLVKEIDAIGIALQGNFIDAETAIRWMSELDALELLDASQDKE